MPLIVNPTSTCDVCLEIYSWDSASDISKPHAIACGHVFCLGCLQRMQPSACPLCRKAFLPDRAKKLHIDRPMEHDDAARVNEFLQRLDSASSECTVEEVTQSLNEVRQWLATRDDGNHIVYRPLRLAISALQRYSLQTERFRRHLYIKDQDLQTSRSIELNLVERISRLEDEYKEKLIRAEKAMSETESELSHLRAEHARFRAELARYQAREHPVLIPFIHRADQVPPPVRTSGLGDRSSVLSTSNALPTDTAESGCVCGTGLGRLPKEPRNVTAMREQASPKPAPRRRRTAGIIPGAPASKKVIPPPPLPLPAGCAVGVDNPAPIAIHLPRNVPVVPISERSESTLPTTARLIVCSSDHGYVVGDGYVPLNSPALAAVSEVEEHQALGQLMLYSEPQTGRSPESRPRTVEAAARAFAESEEAAMDDAALEEIRTIFRRSLALSEVAGPFLSGFATTDRMDGPAAASHVPSVSTDLRDLGILAAALVTRESVFGSTRSIPQDVTSGVSSPEPSMASTWGTISSMRTSRSVSVRDLNLAGLPSTTNLVSEPTSHNSSLADLNLANLPRMRSYTSIDAVTPHHEGPAGSSETPRASPWHTDSSVRVSISAAQDSRRPYPDVERLLVPPNRVSQMMHDSREDSGLGLLVSTSSSSGTHVNGQDDLTQVDASLRQLLDEERSRADRRRRSRHLSFSTLADQPRSPSFSLDSQNASSVSNSLSSQPPIAQSFSGASMSSSLRYEDVPEESRVAVHANSHPDRTRRRHSSVLSASSAVARARNGYASPLRGQDSRGNWNPEAQASSSVTSPGLSGRAYSYGPSSPVGLAASQSRDSVLGSTSLLLSFVPPSTSAATTSGGEPTAIHAPRPIDRRHSNDVFGFLHRGSRR